MEQHKAFVGAQVPKEVKDALIQQARDGDRTVSAEVRRIIRKAVTAESKAAEA